MRVVVFLIASLLLAAPALAVDDWPGGKEGEEIANSGDELPSGFEPSGLFFDSVDEELYVVGDGGQLVMIYWNGSTQYETTLITGLGDIEGVTKPVMGSDYIYVGRENPDAILEVDCTGTCYVRRTFDLTDTLQGPANAGLEALTWRGISLSDPWRGVMMAGLQSDGLTYIFDLGAGDLEPPDSTSTEIGYCCNWDFGERAYISGLHYDPKGDRVWQLGAWYALYDPAGIITVVNEDNDLVREHYAPEGASGDQEGITLDTRDPDTDGWCKMWIAFDYGNGGKVVEYEYNDAHPNCGLKAY